MTHNMLFGTHVSAAGGLDKAPQRAAEVGAEVFQFFSRSPQGGKATSITPELAASFKKNCLVYKQAECYIHTPYYINFASAKSNIRYGSASIIRDELERGALLGVKYVMTHLGSSKDVGDKQGLISVVEGLVKALDGYKGSTQFLIEISAGAGMVIGDTFEEIIQIIKGVQKNKKVKTEIGVCFDTCHAFASGYDLRTKSAVKKTFDDFDSIIGLDKLKLSHCNDSINSLGSHKDRHEHLGKGEIGLSGFEAIVKDKRLNHVNLVLETPKDKPQDDVKNLGILKKFRK